MEELEYTLELVALDQSILVISDLHFPNAHPDWYIFLKTIKVKYRPEIIINVGDEVNGSRWNFHDSDEALPSADEELQEAIDEIRLLYQLFPKMNLCESNHGSLLYRKIKHHGIPLRSLKPLPELYGTPGWKWSHEIKIETHSGKISIVHGRSGAYNKLSMEQGISSVQGHHHSKFEITWQSSTERTIFNMIVGCLIDYKSMAFDYGKNITKKPVIGVGWINDLGEPTLIRMMLDKNERWTGKL